MAYTKIVAKHDRIEIDAVDYSNAFKSFGFTSSKTEEDASGFSVTGVDETLPGANAQGFSGEMFVTEETIAAIAPLHFADTVVEVLWQPNGLVNASATTFYADCTISEFSPSDTRGSVSTTPFSAKTATATGIVTAAGT